MDQPESSAEPQSASSTTEPKETSSTLAPQKPDQLESSVESDAVTVVEKDDNGFVFYKCRFCGLTFNYMNTLRAHERVHDVEQVRVPYVCGSCGEGFHFACELEYHSKQHSNAKGYKCDCGQTFFTYTELLYHRHPEDGPAPATARVPVTTQPSGSARGLTLQDFPAPAFTEQGFEPKHPMKVYSDVRLKPYICEYCSKSYPDSRQLAYHMYSHRGEKIFNPRASRYLMGRTGVGYTDPKSYLY